MISMFPMFPSAGLTMSRPRGSPSPSSSPSSSLLLVCGTYSGSLLGYELFTPLELIRSMSEEERLLSGITNLREAEELLGEENEEGDHGAIEAATLETVFAVRPHVTCVRDISMRGHFLASGSTDENIQVFDTKKRVEIGSLIHHNGAITSLGFFGDRLYSASDDGTIAAWDTHSWLVVYTLQAHSGGVNDFSIFPKTGKALLSVGKDKRLKMWNVITGLHTLSIPLDFEGERVIWSTDGTYFAISSRLEVHLYDGKSGDEVMVLHEATPVLSLLFVKDDVLAVGTDDGFVSFYHVSAELALGSIDTKARRVGEMALCVYRGQRLFATSSSDGVISVWNLSSLWSLGDFFRCEVIPESSETMEKETSTNSEEDSLENLPPIDALRHLLIRRTLLDARITSLDMYVCKNRNPTRGLGRSSSTSNPGPKHMSQKPESSLKKSHEEQSSTPHVQHLSTEEQKARALERRLRRLANQGLIVTQEGTAGNASISSDASSSNPSDKDEENRKQSTKSLRRARTRARKRQLVMEEEKMKDLPAFVPDAKPSKSILRSESPHEETLSEQTVKGSSFSIASSSDHSSSGPERKVRRKRISFAEPSYPSERKDSPDSSDRVVPKKSSRKGKK